jgi:serine/threonine-protein kinase
VGGNAKLMDFGIARPERRVQPGHTQPGMYVGTPSYSAPEQLTGIDIDARADLYSAGVMLSEMFCGGLPYAGETTMEIYRQQLQEEPQRPSMLWPEIPPALEEIILRCIARERDERYQSAAELGADLAQLRA